MAIALYNISWDVSSHFSGLTEDGEKLPDHYVSGASCLDEAVAEVQLIYGFCIQDCEAKEIQ